MLRSEDFFDLSEFDHPQFFQGIDYVWDALKKLPGYIETHLNPGIKGTIMAGAWIVGNDISIGAGSIVEPGAYIAGPSIIGESCTIRSGAYIRGNVLLGDRCIVGHTSELKNAVMLDGSQAPHFNYVGDSILGRNVNLGAGTKLSNLKIVEGTVRIKIAGTVYDSGLRKFGAILGDNAQSGCNSVLSPGTLVGKNSLIYPNATVSGYIAPNSLVKLRQTQEIAEMRSRGPE
ncbi:glucose-1-phosphate thymidylyltransferase [candidate division KSB3 bacterium]|uniref:Glucose-1-phosphate thymidylyltransferase n=1 Tax=candidate division KSB3 bacterium TaxID=2044937 RepID=A0A2G6E493_9BACT|nr:MAG: glucose-1-phosphate thymidylyltransferase [candidate division KSB3 bacterium]PIE29441.1 MAG: glucose-1-phosphate thymidylyltransferase [candidate division KSB3 bacterium]